MSEHFIFNPDIYANEDGLGFDSYIDTLKDMITDPDFKTPFCIGVYGKWGSGKTTFMHLLAKELAPCKTEPCVIPVWFNPWRYCKEEHLIIPFLKTIEQAIAKYAEKNATLSEKLIASLKDAALKMGEVAAAIAYGLKADFKLLGIFGFEFDTAKATDREEELKKQRLDKAKKLSSIYYDTIEEMKKAVENPDDKEGAPLFRITVFIDDLDRCLPEKAVELLEAIKLFLDIPGYLFVIGVAKEVVAKGIACRYSYLAKTGDGKEESLISPEDYLEKMIQLPLELPPIEPGKKRTYIESLMGTQQVYKDHADIIEAGVGDNPRSLKRFVNLLAFMSRHADRVKLTVPKELQEYFNSLLYIKWALIVFVFPHIHNQIKGNKQMLLNLQKIARGESLPDAEAKALPTSDKLNKILKKGTAAAHFFPNEELITRFVHLTATTELTVSAKEKLIGTSPRFQPGQMVKIPKGAFLYGEDKQEKVIDYDYEIGVFPVTNREYKEFIDANENHKAPYVEADWAKPYNWENRTYPSGKENHPVVLVSQADAIAYCNWRSQKEGLKYRLPSEEEWEKAARGTDGREYPWGDGFDQAKCNTIESGNRGTTEVDSYPAGVSPYGCYDMAGNVWEWTDSLYDEDKKYKVLRGGSWYDAQVNARCAYRNYTFPYFRNYYIGFRCLRTSS